MNLWNIRELPLPPITTYKTQNKDIDIRYLQQICQEIKDFFGNNKYLQTEHLILSRIIYRMKTKFRSAKDFKALEKVNRAVDIFLNMNISSNLSIFISLIPSRYKSDTYLPSKNLLDYILVRLQGVTKLLERIVESCKISAHLLNERMHIGHFWKIAFMLFSLVSRIYILAKFTANRICEFYGKLLPFSCKLLNVSKDFLPEGYELPVDLKEWMNVDWLEYNEVIHLEEPSSIPDIMEFFDLIHDDSDVEFCNEYVLVEDYDDEVKLVNEHEERDILSNHEYIQGSEDSDDVEVISIKQAGKTSKCKYFSGSISKGFRGFEKIEDIGEVIEMNKRKQFSCVDVSSIVLDSSSDSIIEETVEMDKKNIDDSILILSDESVMELPPLNRKKPRKSKKIMRSDSGSKSYFKEEISVKDKSKSNQNKLFLKRKTELDLDTKTTKRRKLSNSKSNEEINEESKEPVLLELNRSELMKRKSNKNKIPFSKYKKSHNPHNQLNLDVKITKHDSSSESINENQSSEMKEKSKKTVLVNFNKSTKRKSHKSKVTANKKKPNNTHQLNLDINNSKPSLDLKELKSTDIRKSTKKEKKRKKVVQPQHFVNEPNKILEVKSTKKEKKRKKVVQPQHSVNEPNKILDVKSSKKEKKRKKVVQPQHSVNEPNKILELKSNKKGKKRKKVVQPRHSVNESNKILEVSQIKPSNLINKKKSRKMRRSVN